MFVGCQHSHCPGKDDGGGLDNRTCWHPVRRRENSEKGVTES